MLRGRGNALYFFSQSTSAWGIVFHKVNAMSECIRAKKPIRLAVIPVSVA